MSKIFDKYKDGLEIPIEKEAVSAVGAGVSRLSRFKTRFKGIQAAKDKSSLKRAFLPAATIGAGMYLSKHRTIPSAGDME